MNTDEEAMKMVPEEGDVNWEMYSKYHSRASGGVELHAREVLEVANKRLDGRRLIDPNAGWRFIKEGCFVDPIQAYLGTGLRAHIVHEDDARRLADALRYKEKGISMHFFCKQ